MTKEKQKGNPKFAFLFGGEYYNYYRWKVSFEIGKFNIPSTFNLLIAIHFNNTFLKIKQQVDKTLQVAFIKVDTWGWNTLGTKSQLHIMVINRSLWTGEVTSPRWWYGVAIYCHKQKILHFYCRIFQKWLSLWADFVAWQVKQNQNSLSLCSLLQ